MLRKSLMCAAAVWAVGCGGMTEDEARSGLPSSDMVEIKTPSSGTQALHVSSVQIHSQGERSEYYRLTRQATLSVNGATLVVLKLLEAVVAFKPTTLEGDTAVWGPHSEALSPNAWKLTVTKEGDRTFSYRFEAKPKQAEDSAFVTVLSGTHEAAEGARGLPRKHFGKGKFTLNWENARRLPENDGNVGSAEIRYSRLDELATTSVEMSFSQVRSDEDPEARVDGEYSYHATPGAGGDFDFVFSQDSADEGPAKERLSIKSRWQESGAGRSDVKLSGGDMETEATATDCWDTLFNSQFFQASYNPELNYGTEADDCAFTPALYSTL